MWVLQTPPTEGKITGTNSLDRSCAWTMATAQNEVHMKIKMRIMDGAFHSKWNFFVTACLKHKVSMVYLQHAKHLLPNAEKMVSDQFNIKISSQFSE